MTRDFHRPLTPKKLSQLAESVTQASALEPGLTMVVGPYSELVHLVYATMVKELVQGSSRLPIPLPECSSIVCVHSGPARYLEQVRGLHAKLGLMAPAFKKCQSFERVASCAFDWTNQASVSIVGRLKALMNGGCVVLQQPPDINPDLQGLLELRRAAEKYKARIILFCPAVADEAKISGTPNELFVVTPCEPNPGFDEGFVVSCPGLASPLSPSSGKVLCCVRLGDDGLETEITPYVADDLKTRLMAILKADEWSLEEIGNLVGLNKSNVSRKLRMVSRTVPDGWDGDMLAEWLEACDLDPIEEEESSEVDSVDDDDADDADDEDDEHQPDDWDADDDDEGNDLYDLDRAKPVASARRNERNTRNKDVLIPRKQR